LNTDKDSSTV